MRTASAKPINALAIIGWIYTLLGGLFVALGIGLSVALKGTDVIMIGLIFGGIGSIFLILGIVFLCIIAAKRATRRRLLEQGRYIWGEVIACEMNVNVTINGTHPYYLVVRCRDPYGSLHTFRSESLRFYPEPALIGRQVKVYVSDDSFRHYYVDTEGIFPSYIEH